MLRIKSAQFTSVHVRRLLGQLELVQQRVNQVIPLIQALPPETTIQDIARNDSARYLLESILGNDWFKNAL